MVNVLRFNWIFRTQLRKFCYKTMDELLPPDTVRGMTKLDRGMFTKTFQIPCLVIPEKHIYHCVNLLKSYLLKLNKFKPIQDSNDNSSDNMKSKIIYLDPTKTTSLESIKEKFDKIDVKMNIMNKELTLNYNNWKVDEILRAVVPSHLDSVSSYSIVGHIIHLNLRPELDDYKHLIGQVLLDKIPNSRTVVTKSAMIESEFRIFSMELLAGDNDFIANIKENKCQFRLDFSTVYWNPRLATEHSRIVDYLTKGDVLFDVFAGIGPFSIPAAKKGIKVFANDLNPESIKWLNQNMKLNKISTESLDISNKDGSVFIKENFKSNYIKLKKGNYKILITMNLPSIAKDFLMNFRGLFSIEEKDLITSLPVPEAFVYCFTKNVEQPSEAAKQMITDEMDFTDLSVVGEPYFVRNVAPNKDMFRVPVRLTHEFLLSKKRRGSSIDNRTKQTNSSQ